ncbi:MAG TPA: carbamoyl-phosphate synthase large subunit [Streptosporangiaceae bacterium]|nr:carbamoyl-phosphate synthase large subunit [Streptosporangiaceae bacterium]
MPKRADLRSVLVIGSGPIVIGQACEFDYSGTQACRVLRDEGIRVSLVNSNPATIMTDPEFADATYIEPITPDVLEKVIAAERPDALLPTLGGQTALNAAVALHDAGTLARYGVELIGADIEAIRSGEDRKLFKEIVTGLGGEVPLSRICHTLAECEEAAAELGYPVVVRPSFTMGGSGSGIARDTADLRRMAGAGLDASPVTEVLLEESILGWKEYELELMRDRNDNVVVVCSIENVDPMGVHTGDSITVAPAMTLTDREYQRMRDLAIAVLREVGVDTGGCNIQFAVNPGTGRMVVIELNPRVSRSSALASKATGFPIAKIAARLAIGYTLDEIRNDITGLTPASFEPALDYVVVKVPRFAFEKFPAADPVLTTHMKSVGEAMAIGRCFAEALQKALRSLEQPTAPLSWREPPGDRADLIARSAVPREGRISVLHQALRAGAGVAELALATGIDPWFIDQIAGIEETAGRLANAAHGLAEQDIQVIKDITAKRKISPQSPDETPVGSGLGGAGRAGIAGAGSGSPVGSGPDGTVSDAIASDATASDGAVSAVAGPLPAGQAIPGSPSWRRFAGSLREAKAAGFSDAQIAQLTPFAEAEVRAARAEIGLVPVYHMVDTCAGEFAAATPYLYSSYDEQSEVPPSNRRKVIILGSGPNRIGQGIEFDYACVHACFAASQAGFETVMVNCNPETVSTDYDTSDRLYFEPLTLEDVLAVVAAEQASGPVDGVIVQLGGQTPLGLARALAAEGVPLLGTSPEAIHQAEDRAEFSALLAAAGLPAPRHGTALSVTEATVIAAEIGYPVLVRPSYVLGGRGMEIVYDATALEAYMRRATQASPEHPVLIDRFLDDAIEIDVDALFDGEELYLGGVMEHIEEAGIHSGDSACALPPITLGREYIAAVRESTEAIARGVGVRGLLNVQYALAAGVLYVLEANPRASRTVPFVSKATAVPLAKAATRIMLGSTIAGLRAEGLLPASGDGGALPMDAPIAVKEAVLPFNRFADSRGEGVDTVLGPEMRSTGEVMGIDEAFGTAYAKSQAAAYGSLPVKGRAFVSVASKDKRAMIFPVKRLADLGFEIWATSGTGEVLRRNGVHATIVRKHSDGRSPDGEPTIVERMLAGQVDLVINTPFGGPGQPGPRRDGYEIRTAAVRRGIPCVTTMAGLAAVVQGIEAIIRDEVGVRSLQEHAAHLRGTGTARRAGADATGTFSEAGERS